MFVWQLVAMTGCVVTTGLDHCSTTQFTTLGSTITHSSEPAYVCMFDPLVGAETAATMWNKEKLQNTTICSLCAMR